MEKPLDCRRSVCACVHVLWQVGDANFKMARMSTDQDIDINAHHCHKQCRVGYCYCPGVAVAKEDVFHA